MTYHQELALGIHEFAVIDMLPNQLRFANRWCLYQTAGEKLCYLSIRYIIGVCWPGRLVRAVKLSRFLCCAAHTRTAPSESALAVWKSSNSWVPVVSPINNAQSCYQPPRDSNPIAWFYRRAQYWTSRPYHGKFSVIFSSIACQCLRRTWSLHGTPKRGLRLDSVECWTSAKQQGAIPGKVSILPKGMARDKD